MVQRSTVFIQIGESEGLGSQTRVPVEGAGEMYSEEGNKELGSGNNGYFQRPEDLKTLS